MDHDPLTRLAETVLAFRRLRPEVLPSGLFGETGWEILLELFVADARGERLTGREFVERSDAFYSTTDRWLNALVEDGLIQSAGNYTMDSLLTVTQKGLHRMENILGRARVLLDEAKQD